LDHVAVHLLPGLGEQLDRLRLGELNADLGDDPAPAAVEHRDRVGGEDLVPRHRVHEHRLHRALLGRSSSNLTDLRPGPYDHIVELGPIKWNLCPQQACPRTNGNTTGYEQPE